MTRDVDDSGFLSIAAQFAKLPFSAVLLSGGSLDCSRYSIIACDPFLVFTSKGDSGLVRSAEGDFTVTGDPLTTIDTLCRSFKPNFALKGVPFAGGAVGYLSYDLKNQIEDLPQTAADDLQLPDVCLFWPSRALVHDREERHVTDLTLACGMPVIEADPDVSFRRAQIALGAGPEKAGGLRSNFTRDAYLTAVAKIREYIAAGDVYQVNLSQRFQFPFPGDPFELFAQLFSMNPAPFYAFIQAGDHQALSTSMERFLYRRGQYIETRPIKGTRKRGATPEEDSALRRELEVSQKDDAELSMIVDLLRNDLGRVAEPRSVRVAAHKRVEAYQNVYHLVSTVVGSLRADTTHADLLRATFPGGSITGCPKIRAMEIIDELEPNVRHVYTGSIGYLGWHDNLDLNIAIRTAIVKDRTCYFSVGGGVVYDSDPAEEYLETLHKGRTIFQWLESCGDPGL